MANRAQVRTLLDLLTPYAMPYAWGLVGVFLLGLISATAARAPFLLLVPTWDVLFPSSGPQAVDATNTWIRWCQELFFGPDGVPATDDGRIAILLRLVVVMAGLGIVAAATHYALVVWSRWISVKMIVALRVDIARHLLGLSLSYHSKRKFGDLLSRVTTDVTRTLDVVNIVLKEIVQEPTIVSVSLIMAFLVAPQATLLVLLGLPLLIAPIAIVMGKVRKRSRKTRDIAGEANQVLTQMFQGIRTVKAFRGEDRELERYRHANEGFVRATMRMVQAIALSRTWTILYTTFGFCGIALLVGWLSIGGGGVTDPASMVTFFLLISGAYKGIKATTRAWTKVAEAIGSCERLDELLEKDPEIVDAPEATPIESLGSGIRFEEVSFAYPGDGTKAIADFSIELEPGETLALVGPSGAGKTTLIDLVARFIEPQAGQILVDGRDLCTITLESWTAMYSMVTQEPFLFHASIEDNLRFGKADATDDELHAAARAADIHDFIMALPSGYRTNVDDAGARLSGGQRQRLSVARAMLHGGQLLLLDEATSALDTESEAVVQAAIERLMQDHTVIVVAHRLSTVRNANRIAVLDQGKLVELGTHDELIASRGYYARLLELQRGDRVGVD